MPTLSIWPRGKTQKEVNYQVVIDGDTHEFQAVKMYAVNSGMMGTGFSITHTYAIDNGVLDAFFLDSANLETMRAATSRSGLMESVWAARPSP